MTLPKIRMSPMLPTSRMTILQAEFARAVMHPLFNEPEKYCILLDVIQDAIDEEREIEVANA